MHPLERATTHLEQYVVETGSIQTERDTFRPWLEKLAKTADRKVADEARRALDRWSRP